MNATKNLSHRRNNAGCIGAGRNPKKKKGDGLSIQTSFNGKQADTSKCRTHINDAGLAECTMEIRCPWALRVGHSVDLVTQILTVCRHPAAAEMAKGNPLKA